MTNSKSGIEIIDSRRFSDSLCSLIGRAVSDTAVAESEVQLIQEPEVDEEIGSAFYISLSRVQATGDWIIRAPNVLNVRFWIIFRQDLEHEARATMGKLETAFERYFFVAEEDLPNELEVIFRELENH